MKIQDFKLSILSHYASANQEHFEQQLFHLIQILCIFCGFMATFFFLTKTPSKTKVSKKGYLLLLKELYYGTNQISRKNSR